MDEQPKVESRISHKSDVFSVCFSPDQTKLCSVGNDEYVILTNLQNYKTQKVFYGHKEPIHESDFSSNGFFLATASDDRTVRIWNVESEDGNSTKLEGHLDIVICTRFLHKDSLKVISGSADKMIKIWDIERKKEISNLKGCEMHVLSVDILPDNQTIVSGDSRAKLRIWDFRSGKCVRILDHHKDWVYSVQFHPNSFSLASGSFDKTIKIFDFRTFQLLQNYEKHSDWVNSVCFHPSGKFLLSGSYDKTINLFDLSQKKLLYTLNDHSKTVLSVQFSPDGKSFASGGDDKQIFIWNFPLGRMFHEEQKDIDEKERVNYLIQQDLLLVDQGEYDYCERNVLKIRIFDEVHSFYCFKFFFI